MTDLGEGLRAPLRPVARLVRAWLASTKSAALSAAHRLLLNAVNRRRHSDEESRRLEVGPGERRIPGFETLNIVWTPVTDYVLDASRVPLPFADGSFEVIYASHVLEHLPWYKVAATLGEWWRLLEPGGRLEVWVPDGLKIARAFVSAEDDASKDFESDGWWRFNPERDPAVWANGRVFSYGDGLGTAGHHNWHIGLFSERYLAKLLYEVGFTAVRRLNRDEVRGDDHGWINLGLEGRK